MNVTRLPTRAAVLLFALAAHPSFAQAPIVRIPPAGTAVTPAPRPKPRKPRTPAGQPPAFNPNLILLDPAHGGDDPGGQITPDIPEKQVNLDFARRLRTLLAAKGFIVTLARESDPVPQPAPPPDPDNPDVKPVPPPTPPQITPDQRAELANRIRPVACILIHSTTAGRGVHLYTSALAPPFSGETPRDILLWDTAQSTALANSARLMTDVTQAIQGLGIPLVTGQASIRPIDSMTCAAFILELAPIGKSSTNPTPVTDESYQLRIADAVTNALTLWRTQAQNILDEQAAFAARAAERAAASGTPAKNTETPKPRPRPKPAPGSLVPNAPPALPKIPQIPKIVAPKSTTPPPPSPGGAQ